MVRTYERVDQTRPKRLLSCRQGDPNTNAVALNPVAYTENVVRIFLRYQPRNGNHPVRNNYTNSETSADSNTFRLPSTASCRKQYSFQ